LFASTYIITQDGAEGQFLLLHFYCLANDYFTLSPNSNISVLIELAQLISYRGLFEFDDMIHNALGTALGVLIVLGLRRLLQR
jgi:glycopeptide antibiotics resistance protein